MAVDMTAAGYEILVRSRMAARWLAARRRVGTKCHNALRNHTPIPVVDSHPHLLTAGEAIQRRTCQIRRAMSVGCTEQERCRRAAAARGCVEKSKLFHNCGFVHAPRVFMGGRDVSRKYLDIDTIRCNPFGLDEMTASTGNRQWHRRGRI